MSLKIGDKVRVVRDPHDMVQCNHVGKVGEVSYIVGYGTDKVAVTFCGHDTAPFSEKDLTKAEEARRG